MRMTYTQCRVRVYGARACARNCSDAVSSREGSRAGGGALVATGFGKVGSGANATCAVRERGSKQRRRGSGCTPAAPDN